MSLNIKHGDINTDQNLRVGLNKLRLFLMKVLTLLDLTRLNNLNGLN